MRLNEWALAGDWTVQRQATVLNAEGGRIAYRFRARDLHLVIGLAARETSVRFRVLIDCSRGAMRLAIMQRAEVLNSHRS